MIFLDEHIVFVGSSFMIYDLSGDLPRHKNFPHGSEAVNPNTNKRDVRGEYTRINDRKISTIIAHQTAGGYGSADKQVFWTGQFFVKDPTWKKNPRFGKPNQLEFLWTGEGRGWPGFAYTWFVPFAPIVWGGGPGNIGDHWVIYQCNDLDLVTWHTGDGQNDHGGGLAFQGYFLDEDAGVTTPMKGTDGEPSDAQLEILDTFWAEYAQPELGATTLTGHWEHGKLSCPGRTLRERVVELRGY